MVASYTTAILRTTELLVYNSIQTSVLRDLTDSSIALAT